MAALMLWLPIIEMENKMIVRKLWKQRQLWWQNHQNNRHRLLPKNCVKTGIIGLFGIMWLGLELWRGQTGMHDAIGIPPQGWTWKGSKPAQLDGPRKKVRLQEQQL